MIHNGYRTMQNLDKELDSNEFAIIIYCNGEKVHSESINMDSPNWVHAPLDSVQHAVRSLMEQDGSFEVYVRVDESARLASIMNAISFLKWRMSYAKITVFVESRKGYGDEPIVLSKVMF